MKTVNVSELEGAALDWAVGKAIGYSTGIINLERQGGAVFATLDGMMTYEPSFDWRQGGPLFSEHKITIDTDDYSIYWAKTPDLELWCGGPDHLIAACRAIVAAKLGSIIEVPEELL